MATSVSEKDDDRRKQVMVGELPSDFLRVAPTTQQQQVAADEQAALLLQQQLTGSFFPPNAVGKFNLTIAQAKLAKNYGVTRMDPYCRVRIGHTIYETQTDHNGAKIPRWNKIMQSYLPSGVNTFYLEIFDERAFTPDERVAWANIHIPECVFKGETVDDWYPLNGRQGDEKEGMINLVMTMTPVCGQPMMYQAPVVMVPAQGYQPGYYPTTVINYTQPTVAYPPAGPPPVQQPLYTDQDIKQVQEMFPSVELEVVRSIMEANGGNKDATINILLQMANDN
uniref:Uncharacterized protein n=1 Tax=Strigamia maritima TaxID=126957 RepID=T1J5F4_STRMM